MKTSMLMMLTAGAALSAMDQDQIEKDWGRPPFNPGTCKSLKNLSPQRFSKRRESAKAARKARKARR